MEEGYRYRMLAYPFREVHRVLPVISINGERQERYACFVVML